MALDNDDSDNNIFEDTSSSRERIKEGVAAGEVLTGIELKLAYSSEKLCNLEILFMQVEDMAADYKGLTVDEEDISEESLKSAFQFDILSGILNSTVDELESVMSNIKLEIKDARTKLSHGDYALELSKKMELKLQEAEESLKQSQERITDTKKLSAKFERIIAFAWKKVWSAADEELESGQSSPMDSKWKLQTVEQQRGVLQMLEKSLARELDLEKKLTESKNDEDELRLKLRYAEREINFMEESVEAVLERLFRAEYAAEILLGISKELIGKVQVVYFNLNSSLRREGEIRSKLEESILADENKHNLASCEGTGLRETVNTLEEKLRAITGELQQAKSYAEATEQQNSLLHLQVNEKDQFIKDLTDNLSKVESKVESAETKNKQLAQANLELNNELSILKNSETDKASHLERKLKESDTQLEHAKASFEAMEEQKNMLYSTLNDMGNLIEDLKGKVSKAESRAERAESKCSLLTETNLELNEELAFLRGRIESLETSLHEADEAKIAAARDIDVITKIIADMVSKLAMERHRLQLEMSVLTKKNKILVAQCSKVKNDAAPCMPDNVSRDHVKHSLAMSTGEASEEFPAANFQEEKSYASMTADITGRESTSVEETEPDMVRTIEVRRIGSKYVFASIAILFAGLFVGRLLQHYD